MTERERLEREKAEKLAEVAAEYDARIAAAVDPLLIEAREIAATLGVWVIYSPYNVRKGNHDDDQRVSIALAALRRGMELAACPLMPTNASNSAAPMSEGEIKKSAAKIAVQHPIYRREDLPEYAERVAKHAIRATIARLGHGRKAWPDEAELREMADATGGPLGGINYTTKRIAALEMARRLKERMS